MEDPLTPRSRKVKRFLTRYLYYFEKSIYGSLLFIVIPGYYLYLIVYIQPALIKTFRPGKTYTIFSECLSFFGFINITGNMIMSYLARPQVQSCMDPEKASKSAKWYCIECKKYSPVKTMHCDQCGTCVPDKYQHCNMLACCIGMKSRRYYILYLTYTLIGLSFYNYHFYLYLSSSDETFTLKETLKVIMTFHVKRMLQPNFHHSWMEVKMKMTIFAINIGVIVFLFGLFYIHGTTLLRGISIREAIKEQKNFIEIFFITLNCRRSWGKNIYNVLGVRWYLLIFCPFVSSPLPETLKD